MADISPKATVFPLHQGAQLGKVRATQAPSLSGLVGAGDAAGAAVLDAFSGDAGLKKEFAETYARLRKEHPSLTARSAAHSATVEVITKNRESFPPGGFSVHTERPGGGSITTPIPPITGPRLSFGASESAAAKIAATRATEAQIPTEPTSQETPAQAPTDPAALRERIAALYRPI